MYFSDPMILHNNHLEGGECDILSDHADAVSHVLEAPFGDEAEPSCGVALALQLFALAVLHHLALALAELAQRLKVRLACPRILFFPNFCSILHRIWLQRYYK